MGLLVLVMPFETFNDDATAEPFLTRYLHAPSRTGIATYIALCPTWRR